MFDDSKTFDYNFTKFNFKNVHHYNVFRSLEKSRGQPLLAGVHIHVTKSVKPEPKQMKGKSYIHRVTFKIRLKL